MLPLINTARPRNPVTIAVQLMAVILHPFGKAASSTPVINGIVASIRAVTPAGTTRLL
jgi:hypothetical protein